MIEFLLGAGVLIGVLLVCFAVGLLMTWGDDADFGESIMTGILFTMLFGILACAFVTISMAIGGTLRGTW